MLFIFTFDIYKRYCMRRWGVASPRSPVPPKMQVRQQRGSVSPGRCQVVGHEGTSISLPMRGKPRFHRRKCETHLRHVQTCENPWCIGATHGACEIPWCIGATHGAWSATSHGGTLVKVWESYQYGRISRDLSAAAESAHGLHRALPESAQHSAAAAKGPAQGQLRKPP